jgi:hypothetical protein
MSGHYVWQLLPCLYFGHCVWRSLSDSLIVVGCLDIVSGNRYPPVCTPDIVSGNRYPPVCTPDIVSGNCYPPVCTPDIVSGNCYPPVCTPDTVSGNRSPIRSVPSLAWTLCLPHRCIHIACSHVRQKPCPAVCGPSVSVVGSCAKLFCIVRDNIVQKVMHDGKSVSRVTRRQVLQASVGALAIGTVSARSACQQASGATVYVGSSDDGVYALDADTGERVWRFNTGLAVRSSPIVVGGTVYVGAGDPNDRQGGCVCAGCWNG